MLVEGRDAGVTDIHNLAPSQNSLHKYGLLQQTFANQNLQQNASFGKWGKSQDFCNCMGGQSSPRHGRVRNCWGYALDHPQRASLLRLEQIVAGSELVPSLYQFY